MSQSAILRQNQGFLATMPVGVILAWHRDMPTDPGQPPFTPAIPAGWVECNGQTLDDPESPFHGQTIPNLNAQAYYDWNEGGAFLRGGTTSGVEQPDAMQRHNHTDSGHTHPFRKASFSGSQGGYELTINAGHTEWGQLENGHAQLGNPMETDGGPPRLRSETRPVNMSVVWIMKVKQVVSARSVPAVQAAPNAPIGALYVGPSGNIGIGTTTPSATLGVNGSVEVENPPAGGPGNKNPIRGADFAFASPAEYSGAPGNIWTATGHSVPLPEAGTYLVFYNARCIRSLGTRGDSSRIRLRTATGGEGGARALPGIESSTDPTRGAVTLIHMFSVTGPDTVEVQAQDGYGGLIVLREPSMVCVRIG